MLLIEVHERQTRAYTGEDLEIFGSAFAGKIAMAAGAGKAIAHGSKTREQRPFKERLQMTGSPRPFAEKEMKGHRMAYIDEGDGAPIAFQHGPVAGDAPA